MKSIAFTPLNFSRHSIRIITILVTVSICHLIIISSSRAQSVGDYRSNAATMNWNATTSWQVYNGSTWVTASTYPGQNAGTGTVTIRDGHTVTVTANVPNAIGALIVGEGSSGTLVTNNGNRTLQITNDLTVSSGATLNLSRFNLTVNGNTNISGTMTDNNSNGSVTFRGTVTINSSGQFNSAVNAAAGVSYTFQGGIVNNGTFNKSGTLAVNFNTNNQTISGSSAITINGIVTITDITVTNQNSDLTLSSTSTNALTGTGSWEQGSGSVLKINAPSINISNVDFSSNTNTVEYYRNNIQTIYPTTYHHLIISTSSTKTLGGNITINGNLTISGSATLACDIYQITGNSNGTFSMASGTTLTLGNTTNATDVLFPTNFTSANISLNTNSTVIYQNNASQTISSVPTYGHMTIATGGTKYLNGNLTVNGNLTISAGTFDLGSSATNINIYGNATINGTLLFNGTTTKTVTISGNLSGSGTIDMSGGSLTHTLNLGGATNSITTLTTAAAASTVNYQRNGDQTVFGSANYRNLTLSNSGIKTLSGNITVNNNLTIGSSTTMQPATFNLTVFGNTTISGTLADNSTTGSNSLQNVEFSGGTIDFSVTSSLTINGNLSVSSGNGTIGRGNITINGTTTIATGRELTFNNNTGIKTFVEPVTINGSGTWNSTNITTASNLVFRNGITVSSSSGTFSAGAATFNTNNQSLSGNGAFSFSGAVTITGITLTNASTHSYGVTISGTMDGTGTYANGSGAITYYEGTAAPMASGTLITNTTGNQFVYNASGNQNVRGNNYYDLIISGGGGTKTVVSSNATVSNNLIIENNAIFTPAGLNITVADSTIISGTFSDANAAGTNTFSGLVLINSGGSLTATSTSPFIFEGGIINNGTFNKTGTGSVTFTQNQDIDGTQAISIAGNITISAGRTVTYRNTSSSGITISGLLDGADASSQWISAANTVVNYQPGSSTPPMNTGMLNLSASGNTFNYSRAGIQTIAATTYHNLVCSSSNIKSLAGNITINGNLTITGTASLDVTASNYSIQIKGNWINNNIFTPRNGTVTFNGSSTQSITSNNNSFYNVVINNSASGSSAITLSDNMTITNMLTMTDGIINTGSNILILTSTNASNLSGFSSNCYVNGTLRRYIATNTSTYSLPVGNSSNYFRADVKNNNLTGVTYITASFGPLERHSDDDMNVSDGSLSYTSMCPQGMWTIDANTTPTGGSYDIYLYTANLSGIIDNEFAPLKRPTGASSASAWSTGGGTINADNGDGRLASHGYALRKGLTDFSEFAVGRKQSGSSLPIQLSLFTATIDKNKKVNIVWITQSEINNHYFTVERSLNGVVFETLAEVPGAGNSTQVREYRITDDNPAKGVNYYRLKQTDYDGTYTYSHIVSVSNTGYTPSNAWNVFPNPVERGSLIQVVLDNQNNNKQIEIIESSTGKRIHQATVEAEYHLIQIESSLAPGLYLLLLHDGAETYTKKLIVK